MFLFEQSASNNRLQISERINFESLSPFFNSIFIFLSNIFCLLDDFNIPHDFDIFLSVRFRDILP